MTPKMMMSRCVLLILGMLLIQACQQENKPAFSSVSIRLPADPDRLIPLLSRTSYAREVAAQIFLPLLDFDPVSFDLVPVLATSRPEISTTSDGQTGYTFEIRPEAYWDNGTPVTANDYTFTLKAIFHPKVSTARFRAYLNFIDRIEIDPDNSRRFTVYTKKPYMLAETVLGNISILPAYHYDPNKYLRQVPLDSLLSGEVANRQIEKNKDLDAFAAYFQSDSLSRSSHLVVGCGPYQLQKWVTGQSLVLQKKEEWWGQQVKATSPLLKANPDELVYRILPDIQTASSLLQNQELDVLSNIEPNRFLTMKEDSFLLANYQFHTPVMPSYAYIGMRRQNPILTEQKVRRALAHLVDMDAIIDKVLGGLAQPIVGPFHPKKTYYHKGLKPIAFDLQRASELLKDAGWNDSNQDGILDRRIKGQKTDLKLSLKISNQYQQGQKVALLLQEAARKIGVSLKVEALEFNKLIEDYRRRDFDLILLSWQLPPIPDDPRQLWHTDSDSPSGSNRVGFGNAASDALIDSIGLTLDPAARLPLYLRFQEMVYEDQPYIFLYTPLHRIAIHSRFSAKTHSLSPGYFPGSFQLK